MSKFKVYWTNPDVGDYYHQSFGKEFDDMKEALDYCQYLRRDGRKFVTMCSEIEDMVGDFGVTETDATYNWKKRR